jgi:3-oxoacyl-[acyl-carrier protein] reductase
MNIIVTGVSKGLGLKTAKMLLEHNYTVYGISRSMSPELHELLLQYYSLLKWIKFDLSEPNKIHKDIFEACIDYNTPIHGLVNNAAIAYDDIITNFNIESYNTMNQINVVSPMVLTKYAIRNMILHKTPGSIVHISSISAHTGYKGLSMYASTKGAIEAFSNTVAREWGTKGIRSNCIVAGFMNTEMSSTLSPEQRERIYQRNSLKKAVNIDSVTNTILYLLDEKSESITGQNIYVDNGTI